jgi:uncharacterized membrane protein
MAGITNGQREELRRKVQEEQVKRVQKRPLKTFLTILCFLGYNFLGFGWSWRDLLKLGIREAIAPIIVTGVINILVAVWIYIDAKRRSMRAVVWALFTFFLMPAPLVLYLLETQKEPPVSRIG